MSDDLLRELGKQLPWDRPDEGRRDAVRSSLLVEASEHRRPRTGRPFALGVAFAAGALAAAAVALVVVRNERPRDAGSDHAAIGSARPAGLAPRSVAHPVQITASSAARLEHDLVTTATGVDQIVRVRDGAVRLAVGRVQPSDHVRVRTNDAEVEGAGDYEVVVVADTLTSVTVRAGSAQVQVTGQRPVFLAAGQTWRAAVITADLTGSAIDSGAAADPASPHADRGTAGPTSGQRASRTADIRTGGIAGRTPDNRTPDNRTPDNRTPDNRTDNRTPDNRTPDSRADSRTPDSRADNRTLDNRTPDSRTPDNRTPDNRAGQRAAGQTAGRGTDGGAVGSRAPIPTTLGDKQEIDRRVPATTSPAATPPAVATSSTGSGVAVPVTRLRTSTATERHFQAGWALLRQGKAREAAVELAAAADAGDQDPLAADARYFQAVALVRSDQRQEAERVLVAFLDRAPRSLRRGRASVLLAKLIASRGDLASARAWYGSAIDDPDPSIAAAARAGIEGLEPRGR